MSIWKLKSNYDLEETSDLGKDFLYNLKQQLAGLQDAVLSNEAIESEWPLVAWLLDPIPDHLLIPKGEYNWYIPASEHHQYV